MKKLTEAEQYDEERIYKKIGKPKNKYIWRYQALSFGEQMLYASNIVRSSKISIEAKHDRLKRLGFSIVERLELLR